MWHLQNHHICKFASTSSYLFEGVASLSLFRKVKCASTLLYFLLIKFHKMIRRMTFTFPIILNTISVINIDSSSKIIILRNFVILVFIFTVMMIIISWSTRSLFTFTIMTMTMIIILSWFRLIMCCYNIRSRIWSKLVEWAS